MEGSDVAGKLEEDDDAGSVKFLKPNIPHALELYGLTEWELVWDKEIDTKAMLCWNKDTLVVAFKGTSSFENVKTDLNVSTIHLPLLQLQNNNRTSPTI